METSVSGCYIAGASTASDTLVDAVADEAQSSGITHCYSRELRAVIGPGIGHVVLLISSYTIIAGSL